MTFKLLYSIYLIFCDRDTNEFFFPPVSSIADYSKGFGGKFGVQKDRVDKSALGYDHKENVAKHESQTGNRFMSETGK